MKGVVASLEVTYFKSIKFQLKCNKFFYPVGTTIFIVSYVVA
jgi:hypothetical protein